MTPAHIFYSAAVSLCAVGAAIDLRTETIPNWLTLPALAMAPVAHFAVGWALGGGPLAGLTAAGFALLGAIVAVAPPAALYAVGAMFGGDLKLLAAVGAILQPSLAFEAVIYTFVAGAFLSILHMAFRGKLGQVLRNSFDIAMNPFRAKEQRRVIEREKLAFSRFGPAIFIGVATAVALAWAA